LNRKLEVAGGDSAGASSSFLIGALVPPRRVFGIIITGDCQPVEFLDRPLCQYEVIKLAVLASCKQGDTCLMPDADACFFYREPLFVSIVRVSE